MKLNNLMGKATKHADLLGAGLSIWTAGNGNLEGIAAWYTNPNGALAEVMKTVSNPTYLMHKLFSSPHLYTQLIRAGIIAYLAGEVGLIGAKWKNLGKKLATGAAVASFTLQGHGGPIAQKNSTQQNFANAPPISRYNY